MLLSEAANRLMTQVTWKDCSVECARAVHARVTAFFNKYICCPAEQNPLFGRILEKVLRYESQGRGSLHVHALLWTHPEDVDAITAEITCTGPGELNAAGTERICPTDPMVCPARHCTLNMLLTWRRAITMALHAQGARLFNLVKQKQTHTCDA